MARSATRPATRSTAGFRSAALAQLRAISTLHIVAIIAAFGSMAADYGSHPQMVTAADGSCRSQHFVVQAASPEFSRQVCAEAERFRRELAIEWLGHELPPWEDLCQIRVKAGQSLGAGGATSFTFINGHPRGWDMEIQGSQARILDSVLPHEVTHTIMATHFGRPLPRWADEGAATSVEDTSERSKQDKLLIQFLTSNRGIAFNQMFAMKEYPRDILPLYSQGYSLARYFIARGGKRKFVEYVGDGMKWDNWTAATEKHYKLRSLSDLQVTWLDWVRQGSPDIESGMESGIDSGIALAMDTQPVTLADAERERWDSNVTRASGLVPLPSPVAPSTPTRGTRSSASDSRVPIRNAILSTSNDNTILSTSPSNGWYSRRRDEAANQAGNATTSINTAGTKQHVGRPSILR